MKPSHQSPKQLNLRKVPRNLTYAKSHATQPTQSPTPTPGLLSMRNWLSFSWAAAFFSFVWTEPKPPRSLSWRWFTTRPDSSTTTTWGGGGKTKEISMKNIGVKVLITKRIIWNSKQTQSKHKANTKQNTKQNKKNIDILNGLFWTVGSPSYL